jgi:hypothetical protein
MASGNFISSTGTNANLYVVWSSTTNVAANTSSVTAVVYLRSYTMRFTALANSYITINGNQLNFNGKVINKSSSSLTDTELARHTVTVAHNSDGAKSITITANLDFDGTVSGKYIDDITASKTVSLDTIPRASGLSVTTSVNTGSNLTATISPASTAFTHKIAYIIGNTTMFTSGTIAAGTNIYTYLIPDSWLPSLNSTSMVVRLYTYSGTTHVGTTDKSVTVSVPTNIIPTVSALAPTVINGLSADGKVVSTGGQCVEGKSQVKLVATAKAGNGSTLASYEFSGPNIYGSATTFVSTSNTVTSSVVKSAGVATYGVIAKDARPNRASVQKTAQVTVYPYAPPQITSITAQRCLANGTIDKNGTYAKVTITTAYSPVNGANKRVVTLYNSKDASGTVVLAATNTNNTYTGVYGSNFATGTNYTIRAVITDSYHTSTTTGTAIEKSVTLGVAERTLNIAKYGNGLAVGGLSTVTSSTASGLFECNWDASFTDNVSIDGLLNCKGVVQTKGMPLIPRNADFNTYITPGTYLINSNAIAETVLNRPTAESGVLIVYHCAGDKYDGYPWSYVNQEYTTIGGTTYHRTASTGDDANEWTYGSWGMKSGRILSSLGSTGYQKLPTGLIIAWGETTITHPNSTYATATVTFPITFPNNIVMSVGYNATRAFHCVELFPNTSMSGGTIYLSTNSGSSLGQDSASSCRYFVVGY